MESTRNKNTPVNYKLEDRHYKTAHTHIMYENGSNGSAYDTRIAGNGLNPGNTPWNKLSTNAADIESFLFGINATNLVNPAPPLTPELKCLQTANIFKTGPVIMPVPQAVPKFQRPFPLP